MLWKLMTLYRVNSTHLFLPVELIEADSLSSSPTSELALFSGSAQLVLIPRWHGPQSLCLTRGISFPHKGGSSQGVDFRLTGEE